MNKKLSVIVPYVQEAPQVLFTIRAIHEELRGIPHEIIAVDNLCREAWAQIRLGNTTNASVDRGHNRAQLPDKTMVPVWEAPEDAKLHESSIRGAAKHAPWLTYLEYSEKLSHWNAKRVACEYTDAGILLFCDAHVVPARGSLSGMYNYYAEHHEDLNGSLHAPLTYQILEDHKLIYKLVYERGLLGYSFTGYRDEPEPYEVPVMSTCGMMISRKFLDFLGGWPKELGIYGGGENFINAALAVTGKKKWIMTGPALHHHGDKRGYHWNWLDHKRNQAIAMYVTGGEEQLWEYLRGLKPYNDKPEVFAAMANDIIQTCSAHRVWINDRQVTTLDEWVKTWKE